MKNNNNMAQDNNLEVELKMILKKYNQNTYYILCQNEDDSDCYLLFYEINNVVMAKMLSGILFQNPDFEIAKDIIISDILRYIDPLRVTGKKENSGNFREIPFAPSVFMND